MSALNSSVVSQLERGIVLGEKNTSLHHYKSGACYIVSCVMTWWILFSETW